MNETTQTPQPSPALQAAPVAAASVPAVTAGGPVLVLPPAPARGRRWLGWLAALILLGVAGAAGWWSFARPPVLGMVMPWRGPALEAVYATGVVEAVDAARVGTTVAARILALAVDEGDRVTAGQVIAQLDDRQAQQRVSDARARLALAEQELARDQALAAQSVARCSKSNAASRRATSRWRGCRSRCGSWRNTVSPARWTGS